MIKKKAPMGDPIDISLRDYELCISKKELTQTIASIEEQMRQAAKELDFERAMELRDILFELKGETKL